jgi:hypothetical protein
VVRAGSRSLPSRIDVELSDGLRQRFGLDMSPGAVRLWRDYGALSTERVLSGDRRRWRYVPATADLVIELTALEAEGLTPHEAVLVAFVRGRPVAERGVRRAYRSYFERRRRHLDRWFADGDVDEASDQATVALLRNDVGRRLREVAKGAWVQERAMRSGRVLRRTWWVDEHLREAVAEPLAVATGRTPDQIGVLLSLLQGASGGLPASEVLETMRDPGAREIVELLRLDRYLERTQDAVFAEMVEVARQLREEPDWAEGRDLINALIAPFLPESTRSEMMADLAIATVAVPSILVELEHRRATT